MRIPLFQSKPEPPTHRDQTSMPEQTCNVFERLTIGWLWPLFRTGFKRPIEEEDVWHLADSRLSATISDQLARNFYARCPPSRRPMHLGGRNKVQRGDEGDLLEGSNHDNENEGSLPKCDDAFTKGEVQPLLDVDASPIARTVSLVENASRVGFNKHEDTETIPSRNESPERPQRRMVQFKSFLLARFLVIRRLNPWSSYRKSRKLSHSNVVLEEDEHGVRRSYDSSLFRALVLTVWRRLLFAGSLEASNSILKTTSSLVTKRLISFIATSHAWSKAEGLDRIGAKAPPAIGTGIGLAIGLALMQEAGSLFNNHYLAQAYTCGYLMKSAVTNQIAQKSLRLSPRSQIEYTNGQRTSAIGADCNYIDWCFPGLVEVVVQPLTIAVGFALLIINLGPSALVGIGILALASPIMAILYSDLTNTRQQQLKMMDRRVRLTTEVLSAIRQIKLYAYEGYFSKRITEYREKELARLRKRKRSAASLSMVMTLIPTLAAVLSFVTYSLSGNELDVATIFASLQLFNIIELPMAQLPMVITALSDVHIAILRITKILTAEEQAHGLIIDPTAQYAVDAVGDFTYETAVPPDQMASGPRPGDKKANKDAKKKAKEERKAEKIQDEANTPASQNHDNKESLKPFVLTDIRLRIEKGSFVVILGRIGAGKTALLEGLLGEMRQTRGAPVRFGGTISLVTQTPWIQSTSLKDNILFGAPMDSVRLQSAIYACALAKDLEQLSDGISTEIGERGINLSGGQRSRVALARAAYSSADVVILDDPLSAVDSHVSAHLTEHCLLGCMKNKTRILVTHHLEVARHADLILVMDQGRIIQQGTYDALKEAEGTFRALVDEYDNADNGKPGVAVHPGTVTKPNETAETGAKTVTKIHLDEELLTGAISGKTFTAYYKAMSKGGPLTLALSGAVLSECTSIALTLVLSFWATSAISGFVKGQYMRLYAGLGVAIAAFTFVGTYSTYLCGIGASFLMANQALFAVF
ncbi:hypothetical protein NCC49_000793 [Naganishia albida]|nr:hypothetical protein NCC49_000793 [Naganishia albida]